MENKLKLHGLMPVNSMHMIERYNRALKASCDFETKLTSFHIDCSGYSPEIAEECGDMDYLNTHGASKRFIILSVEQAKSPISQSYFSSTVHFITQFINENYKQILSMTALDSVYGELENNIYKIKNLKDILYATKVEVKIETSKGLIKAEKKLNKLIDKIKDSDDSNWLKDDELENIIDIVDRVGDVRKNTLQPNIVNYEKTFYYANHLGGMYVMKKSNENIVLASKDVINNLISDQEQSNIITELKIRFIALEDIEQVYEFLDKEKMIEELGLVDILNSQEKIAKYMKRIAIEHMIVTGECSLEKDGLPSENKIKNYIAKNFDELGSLFEKFSKLNTQLQRNEEIDAIDEEIVFYFTSPSKQAVDYSNEDIVNHLISNYTLFKYEENFLQNRDLFFNQYTEWEKEKKEFVEKIIEKSII